MKRTPLKRKRDKPRKTGLTSIAQGIAGGDKAKASPVKHVNKHARRARFFAFMAWIKTQPCVVCGAMPCDAAHCGPHAGFRRPDDRTCLPLCKLHHQTGKDAHHQLPRSFCTRHKLDMNALFASFNRRYAQIDPLFVPLAY